jgi:hypothetical protein
VTFGLGTEGERVEAVRAFWRDTLALVQPDWLSEARASIALAETRRPLARYNTGAVSEAACVYLRALTERFKPVIAVEVGTFIGTSAMAMAGAGHIFTCDKSNDCVAPTKRITTHPYTGSTRMLSELVRRGLAVDFFFFDGRIKDPDLRLIADLSTPNTVYAFDDFDGHEKGVINWGKLSPQLPAHLLIPPPIDVCGLEAKTTIAVMVPVA